jgi:outer membrane protein TolC
LKDAEEVQRSTEHRYDRGVGTIVEVAQARQVTAQAKLAKVHADATTEDTYLSLISAMGIVPLAKIEIAPLSRRELRSDLVPPIDDVVSAALSRRPDVLGADAARKASLASLRAAQAEFFPKLFLSATGTYTEGDLRVTTLPAVGEGLSTVNVTGHRFGTTVLLGVNVPLFDGGLRLARLDQARSKVDHAEATLAGVRNSAIREIVKAGNAVKTSLVAFEAAESLATAAQTTFDAAHGAYRNSVGSITAVTIAETQLLQAKDAATDAYSAALSAAATLALSAGALGAAPR